jgi:hypothetical protein
MRLIVTSLGNQALPGSHLGSLPEATSPKHLAGAPGLGWRAAHARALLNGLLLLCVALPGCVGAPGAPAANTGTLWGQVRLVRSEGVPAPNTADPFYGDRALRDVTFVDYSRPGFTVVYQEDGVEVGGNATLYVKGTRFEAMLGPRTSAIGPAGAITIENADSQPHSVSCAEAGLLRTLAPGEQVTFHPSNPGPHVIFLLDAPGQEALVFVAPGSYAVTSARGHWELGDLPPGRTVLHLWHPRFPGAPRELEVEADTITKVDMELGVRNMNLSNPLIGKVQ